MERKVSRWSIIRAIVAKDLRLFKRDTVWVMLSIIGLVVYVGIYYVLPDRVDETLTVGVYHTDMGEFLSQYEEEEEGLRLVEFPSEEELEAVIAGDLQAWDTPDGLYLRDREAGDEKPEEGEKLDIGIGLAFPDGFVESAVRASMDENAEKPKVTVYMDAAVPEEYKDAMESAVREIGFAVRTAATGGSEEDMLPVTWPEQDEIILGQDRLGAQIPMRERMKPLFAFFVLMIEAFALSGLVATEVQGRTVTAVLATPARRTDFLAAKMITGTLLAFTQAFIILVLMGALEADTWGPVLVAALLGALMATGIALWVGAAGKDFMGTLYYGMLGLIPILIPAFASLFPGTASPWVRVLPSYGIAKALVDVTAYGESWSGIAADLGIAAAWVVVIVAGGLWSLRRKVASL